MDGAHQGLVVAVECMFTWYWLADVCAAEGIAFVLGHALAMKAIHGGKAKNDKIDSHKIAVLLRGGMLPQAYVSPAAMRSTRDLLRRRRTCPQARSTPGAHSEHARPGQPGSECLNRCWVPHRVAAPDLEAKIAERQDATEISFHRSRRLWSAPDGEDLHS
jgi:hypothetical protein